MKTRKNERNRSKKIFRKTRSKRQRGSGGTETLARNNNLIQASRFGHTKNAAMQLENGADVDARDIYGSDSTALIWASKNGHPETVAMLLEKGADVNAGDGSGSTALTWASRYGETKTEKLLKQHIAAQTLPRHLERQQDKENLAMVMSEKNVGNRGDGTIPLELHREIREYLGGKRKTNRSKKSKKSKRTKRKNRSTRQRR